LHYNIQRIFHPIGQGAFYSERHNSINFNVVYDCGNWKNTNLSSKVVTQAFLKDEIIDILFISHFDADHVNKIKILRNHTTIKKIVLPLLYKEEEYLLCEYYKNTNPDIIKLIKHPEQFFNSTTIIIKIQYISENNVINNNILQNLNKIESSTLVESGTIFKINDTYNWCFIPYNYKYKLQQKELQELLRDNGYDIDKVRNNTKYTLEQITRHSKNIQLIYKKLKYNINDNSMLLYSGLQYSQSISYKNNYLRYAIGISRASCIYTGDSNLNLVKIQEVFKDYWDFIITIQIPHHGDIKCFDSSILGDKQYFCPISVGTKNTYGHPSSRLIADIQSYNWYDICVTEELNSTFIENIYLKEIDE
jgi:beta-lactamase superfamily II metal-dependent hydrolase